VKFKEGNLVIPLLLNKRAGSHLCQYLRVTFSSHLNMTITQHLLLRMIIYTMEIMSLKITVCEERQKVILTILEIFLYEFLTDIGIIIPLII